MRGETGVGETQAEQRDTEECRVRAELVGQQRVTLEDGRYLIYYTFEAKQPPRRSQ